MTDKPIERSAFEEAAFLQYFLSGIQRTNDPVANAMQIHFVPGQQKTKDEFLTRYPSDGAYVEPTLNAAWWAWQERAKSAVNSHAALVAALEAGEAMAKFEKSLSGTRYQELLNELAPFGFESNDQTGPREFVEELRRAALLAAKEPHV